MSGEQQVTTVTILNQTFHIRSTDDPEYVQQLARYVDAKMTELSRSAATVDTLRIAVLAALNIADDYSKAKKECDTLKETVRQRTRKLREMLAPFCDAPS